MHRPAWQRIRLLAVSTLRELLHQRIFGLLLAVTLVFAVGALALRDFNFGASELKFTADLGFGALAFFGSLLAIAATVHAVFSEIEHRTLVLVLTRPVGRLEYVLGKFAGVQLLLGLFCLLLLLVLGLVLGARELALTPLSPGTRAAGSLVSHGGLGLAVAAQWLKFGVLVAVMLLLCSIARSRLFALVAGFLLLASFHAHAILAGIGERGGGGLLRVAGQAVSRVLPDFQRFDLSGAVFAGNEIRAGDAVALAGYGLVFIICYAGLAAFSFRGREF
jgi:ABC-type transport system involved in multi-copper enzyme maturation permease subunit